MRLLSVFFTAAIAMCGFFGMSALASTTAEAQVDAVCPGARVVDNVGPTERDLRIGPFTITGGSFRLTYETSDADQSGLPFFDITVLDQAGKEVGGQVIREETVAREIVRDNPGRFTIEARSEDLKYELTIEDCTGRGNPSSGDPNVPTDPIPRDQYSSDADPPNEDVIDDTISDEPLPDTGGVSLLGTAVFGSIFVFGAFAVLRPVVRRDP
ncbi:MAG TPA: hypothetical protein VFY59_15230 [Rubrobacter sp.]|nr:hypothetical protein [Rubrobacter sp.]